MNIFDILETICDRVKEQFPDKPIYIMQTPQGFKRPSCYVTLIGLNDRDLCKDGIRRRIIFDVVYFGAQDKNNIANPIEQLSANEKLLKIFHTQSFAVKDRCLKIEDVSGGMRDNEVYLTVSFEYSFTPGLEDELPGYDVMRELNMKYK